MWQSCSIHVPQFSGCKEMTFRFAAQSSPCLMKKHERKAKSFAFLCQREVPDSIQFTTQYNIPSMPCGQETDSNTSVSVHQPNSWCSLGKYFTPFKMCNCMTEFLISNLIYSFIFLYLFVIPNQHTYPQHASCHDNFLFWCLPLLFSSWKFLV